MPHDPELVAETRGWFQRAAHDLGAGGADLAAEAAFTGDAVFHAQQAAEKSYCVTRATGSLTTE